MRDFVFLLERQPYYFMYEKSKKDRCERMKKLEQLYEGKAKKVFATDDPDIVIVDYKDDATAFNGEKKGTIVGKGMINNRMTNYIFQVLEKEGVPTHYVKELSDRETALKKVYHHRAYGSWPQAAIACLSAISLAYIINV